MKQFLDQLGLGDGLGNTSLYRVAMFFLLLFWAFTKVYNAQLTHEPIVITNQDLVFLGFIIGGKLIQNHQEASTAIPTTPQ